MAASVRTALLILALMAPALAQGRGLPEDDEIARLVEPAIRGRWAAGIVVGLLDGDRTKVRAFGRFARTPDPGRLVFQIGSVTKTFTGLLLADAVVRGRMKLDDPAAQYASFRLPDYQGTPIRLVDLATHSSGLPNIPDDFLPGDDPDDPYASYGRDEVVAFLERCRLARAPRAEFEYSNLGMSLVGMLVAESEGMDYATAVERRVCEPLGLRDTRVEPSASMRARLVGGHDVDLKPVPAWTFDGLQGGGALWSTTDDLVKWLQAQLHPERTPLAAALRLSQEPHFRRDGGRANGLGWLMKVGEGPKECDHAGETRSYTSYVSFCPERQVGVVVLVDTAGPASIGVGIALSDRLMTGRSRPAPLPIPVTLPADSLDRYVGTYRWEDGSTAQVLRRGDALALQVAGAPLLGLYPESSTRFFLRRVPALPVYFEFEEQGGVVTALLASPDSSRDRGARVGE